MDDEQFASGDYPGKAETVKYLREEYTLIEFCAKQS